MSRLYRSSHDRVIGGVCGGIAELWSQKPEQADMDTPSLYEVDPTYIRLGWALIALVTGGFGLVVYLVAWAIIPKNPC